MYIYNDFYIFSLSLSPSLSVSLEIYIYIYKFVSKWIKLYKTVSIEKSA